MEGYDQAYVAHNIPLLVVSGLGSSSRHDTEQERPGARITSEIPSVETEDALAILGHFKERDAAGLAWNGREHSGRNKYSIKLIGRDYVLPPRSAPLHAPSARPPSSRDASPIPRPIAHSPLSPLTPGSILFPDGLLDSKWIEKHQDHVPSAYLSFYKFTSDPTLSTLHDNQLKTDINTTKQTLSQSGYKTRLIVALLSEGSIVKSPDVEERLANIRKATGLDSKTSLFFLPPHSSPVELEAFVSTILSTIYPVCIEYYRDLSKHSRRKRNRGNVPPPTAPPTSGTMQTLSSQGWNVRYDFKLGVFAEFRQEMDAAVRSYESGYDGLLGPDIMEAIASWNPRWNDARLIADVFAIRILRCLLWNGNTTGAVRRWQSHRDRIRDFVDRRGKGSSTYGWEAWEARWATVMGQIIRKISMSEFESENTPAQFLLPEKSIAIGERLEPWENLHHAGYWFQLASKHLAHRRTLALAIPEEDRSMPGTSPASHIASKANVYDTYLCPEPHEENPLPGNKGVDHTLLIIASLTEAIAEFKKNNQNRLVIELSLLSAKESMRREDWTAALRILRPLWQKLSFRGEGWWGPLEEVGWALRKAAAYVGDGGTVVSVDWELLNSCFTYQPKWHYDLSKSLKGLANVKNRPSVVLHHKDVLSFLSATYIFEQSVGKVGEFFAGQLCLRSNAFPASVPINVSKIKIEFEGSMKPIILTSRNDLAAISPGAFSLVKVPLDDLLYENKDSSASVSGQNGRPTLVGTADLTIRPGQIQVFQFSSLLREAGEAKAVSATFSISSDLFDLDFVQAFESTASPDIWWSDQAVKRKLVRANASSITILPKPPKVDLRFVELQEQYYTNENIELHLEVANGEDFDSVASLDVRLLGDGAPPISLKLVPTTEISPRESQESNEPLAFSIGRIVTNGSVFIKILIPPIDLPAVYDLTLKASYHLVSDIETPVSKSIAVQLAVINPFESNYDFSPRIHPDPWPSFFSHEEGEEAANSLQSPRACGLAQKWCLTSRYFSFAAEELIVEDLEIQVLSTNGGIHCSTSKATAIPEGGVRVVPNSLDEAEFDVFTQKISLDDRGTATLDVSLAIKWRRDEEGSTLNTTILAVPRLLVSSSEPRVLATISYSATIPSMIHFDVTIENPSNHFLTFGLTMEPSEKFAFSGVKQSTLQLVPLSRRTVRFRLVPFIRGDWIGPIRCIIKDRYFQKILKIAPTEGMKADKEGLLFWVPPEDDPVDVS